MRNSTRRIIDEETSGRRLLLGEMLPRLLARELPGATS